MSKTRGLNWFEDSFDQRAARLRKIRDIRHEQYRESRSASDWKAFTEAAVEYSRHLASQYAQPVKDTWLDRLGAAVRDTLKRYGH